MPHNIQFNHEVIMDLTLIEPRLQRPALHIVDRGTHFSAAVVLEGKMQNLYGMHFSVVEYQFTSVSPNVVLTHATSLGHS